MSERHPRAVEPGSIRRLRWTLALVVLYAAAEAAGGWLSGSLALLADAGHMVSDAAAIALTLFAMHVARRPAPPARTFGGYRAEILAALANGVTLVGIAVAILIESLDRLSHPAPIEAGLMLWIGVGGLAVNLGGLQLLSGYRDESLNVRGAWLHVLTDALGSLQVIAAALLISAFGWMWVDPVASIAIALLVVYSSWSLLRQSVAVLMESAPGHLDVDAVRAALLNVSGVAAVHDLHVWTITSGYVSLSAHLVAGPDASASAILAQAQDVLANRFSIRHSTIQVDHDAECGQAHHASD